MILVTDTKLKTALDNLRKNPNFTAIIADLEKDASITVRIIPSSSGLGSSTDVTNPFFQTVVIDTAADAALAKKKWGISGTTEENSIAHELGHVYWNYLQHVKKKTNMLDGKPPTVSAAKWDEILSETTARRFDTYSRPIGTTIPILDKTEETIRERLDFTPFPYSVIKPYIKKLSR